MSFQSLNIQQEYRSPQNNIVTEFYIPVLEKAVSELNTCGYEFDEIQWIWRNKHLGHFYRIDEYTVE